MVKMIMSLMIFMCSIMISLSQPMSLGLTILIQTSLVCLTARMLLTSSWMPLSMFLVMVGGLMVIFMYINSICSNSKFSFSKWKLVSLYSIIPMYNVMTQMFVVSFFDSVQLKDNFNLEFMKLFMPLNIYSSMFTFLYLLIMLMIMINMVNFNSGPLRKKY